VETHTYGLGWYMFPRQHPSRSILDQCRNTVAGEVASWLSFWRDDRLHGLSDFTVKWNPEGTRWELKIDYHSFLFAALALQLALSIAGADSLYTCSGCGAPYVRELKRPKPGTANYCPKCSERGVAQRRAVDAYRGKKAEAIRLDAAGTSTEEIAEKLDTPLSRIRKWLGKESPTGKEQQKRGR